MRAIQALILMIMVFGGNTSAQAQVLFSDSFNSGASSSEWRSVQGTQWVQGGMLYSQDQNGGPRDSQAVVHDGDISWANYTVSMTVNPIETWVTDATVLFRTNGFDRSSGGTSGSAYQLSITNADTTPGIYLSRVTNGVWNSLATSFRQIPTGPMDVFISASEANIRVLVDGSLVFNIVDANPISFGGVGIHNIWESIGSYDNVLVTALPVPEPETYAMMLAGLGLLGWQAKRRKLKLAA